VWKNDISAFNNSVPGSLSEDLQYTLGLPQNNSFSLKLIWFLDYHAVSHGLSRGFQRDK
jgi:hypothetical protein